MAVTLSMNTILRECSLGDMSYYDEIRLTLRKILHDLFRLRKYNEDFIDTCICNNSDGKYLVGFLQPSYDEFLEKICSFLNLKVEGPIVDDEELTKALLKRVEVLKSIGRIKDEQEAAKALKKEFPVIFHDVFEGQSTLIAIDIYYRDPCCEKAKAKAEKQELYRCGLFKNHQTSIKRQAILYERYINGRKHYKDIIGKRTINEILKEKIDINKLYMYVMHEYLRAAESTTDKKVIKTYVGLVKRYLASSKDKTVSITTDDNQKIDIYNINERLEQLEKALQATQETVCWVLIPEGKDLARASQVSPPRETLMNSDEISRLIEIGRKKNQFYEDTNYLAKVVGLHRYKGYIGYIYPNGKVILDRYFNEKTPSSAKGDAIYIINVDLFESLSGKDKLSLRKDKRVGVMNHTSSWEERVQRIINAPATEETLEKSNQLVKRLKERSS